MPAGYNHGPLVMFRHILGAMLALLAAAAPVPAAAQSARDLLAQASFGDRDQATALRRVNSAENAAAAALQRRPGDREAALMRTTALGYRAKLTGSRSEAIAARKAFEAIVARDPNNAEALLGLGAWHMGAVNKLGRLVARAALGAQRGAGLAALDRAVALGGNRAFITGLSALLRVKADPTDPRARQLTEAAARAGVANTLDRVMQRAATAVLVPLRAGKTDAARTLASRLLPFGAFDP